jgi:pimeloyl-ACP methyl ester carboxylesterase
MLLEHHRVPTNGITLHVVQAGPADGPLVLLLHGFPEFWMGWVEQIDALTAAGYRVWVPDQRGYNESDRPHGVSLYDTDVLVADVRGLIEASGRKRANVIAHDWGGAVAWLLAGRHRELLERLIVLNCPHPSVMLKHVRSSPKQMLRSWYMAFFQVPRLPEFLLSRNNHAALVRALVGTSKPGSFSRELIAHYRQAWSQPDALTSMINWYRALLRRSPKSVAAGRIDVPTLLVWGAKDTALTPELAQPSIQRCTRGELVMLEDVGHWLLHEAPERVNPLLLEFLRRPA